MISKIFETLKNQRKRRAFFKHQKNTFGLSKGQIRKANRMGFTADEYMIYDLEHNSPRNYIREFERYRLREKLLPVRILLDNKIVFNQLICGFAPVMTIYAYKQRGAFVSLCSECADSLPAMELIKQKKIVCFKMESSGGGNGFHLLACDGINYSIDRTIVAEEEIKRLLERSDNYLLEEYCKQSDFENSLFPGSVNTLRIITMTDGEGRPFVFHALQRMGAKPDAVADNASVGGVFSNVDISTGVMSSAVCSYSSTLLCNTDKGQKTFARHPVTGTQIEGVRIPSWDEIKSQVLSFHGKLLYTGLQFIAWDVALTESGIRIIEGNTTCGLGLLQRNGGQRFNALGEYYRRMGIIK